MNAAVILNKHSGTKESESITKKIESGLNNFSIKPEIFLVDKNNFKAKINTIKNGDFNTIIAAGGDGTINSAAAICIEKNIPLGIIPFGTYNHFAKDLKIPLNLTEALEVIGHNKIISVDAAIVNDKIFLNNSSVGLYPKAVKKRDEEIEKIGGIKFWAMLKAALKIFKKFPVIDIKIAAKEKQVYCKTPFVFIGNNSYKMDLFNLGSRDNIDTGKLCVYFPNTSGKYSVFKFFISGLFNRLEQENDFNIIETDGLILESKKRELEVSLDGEVTHMSPPLNYKILHKILKVFVKVQD